MDAASSTASSVCKPPMRNHIFPPQFESYNFPVFHGRGKEVETMKTRFWGGDDELVEMKLIDHRVIQVVCGMGGLGKTTLAAYYARTFRKAYGGGVFAFHAQSRPAFHKSLRIHMARLTGETSTSHATLEVDYQRFLSLLAERGNVLLVFDSCDKLSLITNLLPTADSTIHVIITTRRSKGHSLLDRQDNIVCLRPLEKNDAIRATLNWAGRSDDLSCLDEEELSSVRLLVVASDIEALPLALRHVGTHVKESGLTFQHYLQLVRKGNTKRRLTTENLNEILQYYGLIHLHDVLSDMHVEEVADLMSTDLTQLQTAPPIKPQELKQLERIKARAKSGTTMTWEFDIEEVSKRSSVGRTMLEIASLLDCKNIPNVLLLETAFATCSGESNNESVMHMAIFLLDSFSLVHKEGDQCSMHSLVQQSVVEMMVRDGTLVLQLRDVSQSLTKMLPQSLEGIRRNLSDGTLLSLTSHVYMVASHIMESQQGDEECWQLLQVACCLAIEYQHLTEAQDLCERRLSFVRTAHNQQSEMGRERVVESLLDLGNVYLDLGSPQGAKEFLEEALSITRKFCVASHPSLHANALGLMGMCNKDLKQFEEAETMFLEGLHFVEQHGFSQQDISAVINNLAVTYYQWGNIALAIDKYEKSVSIQRRQFNVNHMDLSITLGNLAWSYLESGQLDQALCLFEEVLTIRKRELPPSHPLLAEAMRRLSACYLAQGRLEEAIPLADDALRHASTALPDGHPGLGFCLYSVAECHRQSGAFDESVEFYERAMDIFGHHLPQHSTSLAIVKRDLAMAYDGKGRTDKAVELMKESIEINKQQLPETHPQTAKSLVGLGAILCKKGDLNEAGVHLDSGVSILLTTLPASLPTSDALYWLGFIALNGSQLADAQQHLTKCLRMRRAIYPHGHSDIASAEKLLEQIVEKQQLHGCCIGNDNFD